MPLQPTRSQLHVDRPLTNLSIATMQDLEEYIADKVFPVVPVLKQSDRYLVYGKDDWYRSASERRAPATPSVGTGYTIDNTPSYFCNKWSVHHDVPDEDYDNADAPLDPESDGVELVTRHQMLRKEIIFMRNYMAPGVWTGYADSTGVVKDFQPNVDGKGYWDSSVSDPARDIDKIKQRIKSSTGIRATSMVVTEDVYFQLRNHPDLIDRFKYTRPGILDWPLLADVFGVPNFFVAGAVLNTAAEGQPGVFNYMTRNAALVCYTPTSAGIRKPAAGITFAWKGNPAGTGAGVVVKKFYMDEIEATRIESNMYFDQKIVGADLGVFVTGILQNP